MNIDDYLNKKKLQELGITARYLDINDTEVILLYIQQLTDRIRLSSDIINPLLSYNKKDISINKIISSIIYIDDISTDNHANNIINYVLKGNSVIIIPSEETYIIANTLKIQKRQVQEPNIENTIKGARDSFTENYDDNISLIRYRLKDPKLRIDEFEVGKRTQTAVAVIYIEDIANEDLIKTVKDKISKIEIDGILESSHIEKFILNNSFNFFPQSGIVERSDTACSNILEGKIIILVEGGNLALVVPKTFIEFFDTGDDHFDNTFISIFSKFIRILCIFISLFLTSLYVIVVSFHTDILPPEYIISLAVSRATVPFNAFLEALLMELVAEILREASVRLPKQIGPAIGIVGTIVIGQASVAAGLVSPLLVIIVSLCIMSSFATADYSITNTIRLLKFVMLIITSIFGLFGFTMGIILITVNLCSIDSFGVSYVAPLSPLNFRDLKHLILSDVNLTNKRPKYLKTKDDTRQ
ncbi:spore germination protein [Vallitalea longa]|uniref:Spore germination protein n=1 Tax=Vallitalea longa TaxID=2936439 RepID=A0A9W5YB16_9FIRM|nr:spore germination protein [Vallitalea longa]GKX28003.1 spore germination protein [Vallitalea longa]